MGLVVVSNQLPFTVSFKDGVPEFDVGADGSTSGRRSCLGRASANGAEANSRQRAA
jgi:hypothetical protein